MFKKLVIFDFDGVLVNTTDLVLGIMRSTNPHLSDEYLKKMSSGNFYDGLQHAVSHDGYVLRNDWEELYKDGLKKLTTHDVIRKLVLDLSKDFRLAIVSSSHSRHIIESLEEENIRDRFEEILGSDTHARKTIKINQLLTQYGLSPKETIFVTDTLGDMREGNECSVRSIGVTWGLHTREEFENAKPFAVVDTVPELEAEIYRFFGTMGS